jgi:flagellin
VSVPDGTDITTQDLAQKALGAIDEAIVKKDNVRAALGASQNRLSNTIQNLQIQAENLQAASRASPMWMLPRK